MSVQLPAYRAIAQIIAARENCKTSGNLEWFKRHTDRLVSLCLEVLPSGSGIDSGNTIDLDKSTSDRIVVHTSFHHMDESGGYDGWTEHTVTVRPSLAFGFELTVSGRDRNEIKEYLSETFHAALSAEVRETYNRETDESEFSVVRS